MKRIHPIILAVIGVPVATVSIMVLDLSVTKSVYIKNNIQFRKTFANSLYNLHLICVLILSSYIQQHACHAVYIAEIC